VGTKMETMSALGVPRHSDESDEFSAQLHSPGIVQVTEVSVVALDGFELGGVLHAPAGSAIPQCAVVFNCGGGIPAIRYAGFATYLASQGIPVLTYDYRGIGASCPARLRGFVATAEDWSELDCSAAITWLCTRYPQSEIVGMAHSVGAMLFGATTNGTELSRLVFVGAHTGYFGDYRRLYQLPMAALWHGVMPVLTHVLGYFPGRALHLGENIPAGVALQWASRRTPQLRTESRGPETERTKRLLLRYKEIHVPTYALSFADDAFATVKGVQRLLSMYSGVTARHDVLAPTAAGLREIGHFGFFRRSNGPVLWPLLLPFLRSSSYASPAALSEPAMRITPPGMDRVTTR
jgi:predicted alpha/beta hydrolase